MAAYVSRDYTITAYTSEIECHIDEKRKQCERDGVPYSYISEFMLGIEHKAFETALEMRLAQHVPHLMKFQCLFSPSALRIELFHAYAELQNDKMSSCSRRSLGQSDWNLALLTFVVHRDWNRTRLTWVQGVATLERTVA